MLASSSADRVRDGERSEGGGGGSSCPPDLSDSLNSFHLCPTDPKARRLTEMRVRAVHTFQTLGVARGAFETVSSEGGGGGG